jgi:hypothetical protein
MNNYIQRSNSDKNKKYSLENEKLYKNVNLFSNSNITKEITKLKENLEFKNKIFEKYRNTESHNHSYNPYLKTDNFQKMKNFQKEKFYNTTRNLTEGVVNIHTNNSEKFISLKSLNSKINLAQNVPPETFFLTKKEETNLEKNYSSKLNRTTTMNNNHFNTTGQLQNFTRYLTGFSENSQKIFPSKTESDKFEKKNDDDENLRHLYRKIFRKKNNYKRLNEIHFEKINEKEEKLRETHKKIIKEENHPKYVNDKIKEIKSKLNFMKGVFDYAYPLVMVKRLKFQNIYFSTYMDKFNQVESLKNEMAKKISSNNYGDISKYFEDKQTNKQEIPLLNSRGTNMNLNSKFSILSNKKLKLKRSNC